MSDYRRIVSYLYRYDNGEKKVNEGFVRLEVRGAQLKLTIHITSQAVKDARLPVWFYRRQEKGLTGILVGELIIRGGIGDFKIQTDAASIMDSGVMLDHTGGMLLAYTPERFFATEWDDHPITADDMRQVWNGAREEEEKAEYYTYGEYGSLEPVTAVQKEVVQIVLQKDEDILTEESDEDAMMSEKEENSGAEAAEERIPERSELAGRESMLCSSDEKPMARNILDHFPRMMPFQDHEISECVRIVPQNIGLLPMEAWVLGQNSFLQHGYQEHKHLIFAKKHTKDGILYLLGVPGYFTQRERGMARMFGFHNFKSTRTRPVQNGEFGYWYVPIIF